MSDQKIAASQTARAAALKLGSAEETALQKRANLSRGQEKRTSFAKHMEARQEAKGAASERREQLGIRERASQEQEQGATLSRASTQRSEQRTERQTREAQREGESLNTKHLDSEQGAAASNASDETSSKGSLTRTTSGEGEPSLEALGRGAPVQEQETSSNAPVQQVDASSDGVGTSVMEQVQQVEKMEDLQRVQQIARELVEACQVGEGAMAKRVMLLEVSMPGGEGSVKVRLRRDGDGIQVRLRGSDAQTTELLRKHQQSLRDEGAKRGVVFKKIEIV